jgi:phosphoglycolate phosphatase
MEHFGYEADETVMIGDSTSDIEMARTINVTAIGVDFYHQQEVSLKAAGAVAVFDDYQLVADFLGLPKN